MKAFLIFVFAVLLTGFVYASCSDSQIDINSASAEKLDELYGIGPVKAEAIISSRPFEDVNDLIRVSGIGEITLEKINEQGLACVEEEIVSEEEPVEEEKAEETVTEYKEKNTEPVANYEMPKALPVINLNAQTIKSGDEKESLDKKDYARYGFIAFCALLVFLFILKARRKRNEFEE